MASARSRAPPTHNLEPYSVVRGLAPDAVCQPQVSGLTQRIGSKPPHHRVASDICVESYRRHTLASHGCCSRGSPAGRK